MGAAEPSPRGLGGPGVLGQGRGRGHPPGDVGTPLGTWVPPWGCGHPPAPLLIPTQRGLRGPPYFQDPHPTAPPVPGTPPSPPGLPLPAAPPWCQGVFWGRGPPSWCRPVHPAGMPGFLIREFPASCCLLLASARLGGVRRPSNLRQKTVGSGLCLTGGCRDGGGSTQGRCRDAHRAGWKCPPKPPAPQHLPICRAPSL